jgi:nucleoside-triphosphatase
MPPSAPRRVLLTGRPGVGKTTLVLRVVELVGRPVCGFVTEEWREARVRMGFRLRTFSGKEAILARRGAQARAVRAAGARSRARVSAYGVDLKALETVGVAELRRGLTEEVLVVIDEVGKMELFSPAFRETVEALLASPRDILATVTSSTLPFALRLKAREDVTLHEVTRENRDRLAAELSRLLSDRPVTGA